MQCSSLRINVTHYCGGSRSPRTLILMLLQVALIPSQLFKSLLLYRIPHLPSIYTNLFQSTVSSLNTRNWFQVPGFHQLFVFTFFVHFYSVWLLLLAVFSISNTFSHWILLLASECRRTNHKYLMKPARRFRCSLRLTPTMLA